MFVIMKVYEIFVENWEIEKLPKGEKDWRSVARLFSGLSLLFRTLAPGESSHDVITLQPAGR